MSANFFQLLETRVKEVNSLLCVGLDPHCSELSENSAVAAFAFCEKLILATLDTAACYKPNIAFFEVFGAEGILMLKKVIALIPKEIPILLDAKRGDIGTTCEAYASAAFKELNVTAITVNPYLGWDSIEPFSRDPSKGVFLICKTSNKSSNDLQTKKIVGGKRLFEEVATLASTTWNKFSNIGLVVGATDIEAIAAVRKCAPNMWILAPGVGAQGGDLDRACEVGLTSDGTGFLVPISRGLSKAADCAKAAMEFRDAINACRKTKLVSTSISSSSSSSSSSSELAQYQSEFISFALELDVLKFGSFTLKSGRQSPYFFNAGLFSTGLAIGRLGSFYASAIKNAKNLEYDVLFGPAYKGIILAGAAAANLALEHGVNVGCAYNRKEVKDHGEGGIMVGAPMKGKRVLIIDDVITAGTAIRESVEILRAAGAIPAGVVVALDRQERTGNATDAGIGSMSAVQAVEAEFQIPVIAIVGLGQLVQFLKQNVNVNMNLADTVTAITAYRTAYGVC